MLRKDRLTRAAQVAMTARRGELSFALRAWALAPAVELLLAAIGVNRTLEILAKLRPRTRATVPAPVKVAEGAAWVDRAYALHLLQGQCLPRAMVQHLIHGLDGTPSRLVIGVRRGESTEAAGRALQAHAWVDEGERPSTRETEGFLEILRLGADDPRAKGGAP